MWNPVKDYPFTGFVEAFNSILGSLFLFCASCCCAYFLTIFNPGNFIVFEVFFGWFFTLVLSVLCIVGIRFLCLHVWTLYQLIYTDDSRIKLCFIVLVTQSLAGIGVSLIFDFDEFFLRSMIVIAGLTGSCFFLRKFLFSS